MNDLHPYASVEDRAEKSQRAEPEPRFRPDPNLYPFGSNWLDLSEGNRIHYVDEGSGPVLLLRVHHLRKLGFDSARADWLAPFIYGEAHE